MSLLRRLQQNPRLIWFGGHLALNFIYTLLILNGGELYGEASAIAIRSDTPIIFISVLLFFSFIYFNIFFFKISFRLSLLPVRFKVDEIAKNRIGFALLVLQILYFVYFLSSGTRVAGSVEKDSSLFSQIWVLIPVDVLFLLFYSTYRDSRLFLPNLTVNIVSNLMRGWTGILLTVVFIESCVLIRKRCVSFRGVLFYGFLIVALYPVLYYGKIFVRYYGMSNDSTFYDFIDILSGFDFLYLIQGAIVQIGDRIQLISSGVSTYEISNQLGELVSAGAVVPFWNEGIHSLALDRLFSEPHRLDVGQAIAYILDPNSGDINWNSNPTFIGWFFIMPSLSFFNIVYCSALVCLASVLIKPISTDEVTKDMFWYMILVLLIPGWYGAYILFVYACFLFFLLHLLFLARMKVFKYSSGHSSLNKM